MASTKVPTPTGQATQIVNAHGVATQVAAAPGGQLTIQTPGSNLVLTKQNIVDLLPLFQAYIAGTAI